MSEKYKRINKYTYIKKSFSSKIYFIDLTENMMILNQIIYAKHTFILSSY